MEAVMTAKCSLGHDPRNVSAERLGYDIESCGSRAGSLRFLEVKGRARGAETVSVTRNEILTALNVPHAFMLAILEVRMASRRSRSSPGAFRA